MGLGYASKLKKSITIRLGEDVAGYLKKWLKVLAYLIKALLTYISETVYTSTESLMYPGYRKRKSFLRLGSIVALFSIFVRCRQFAWSPLAACGYTSRFLGTKTHNTIATRNSAGTSPRRFARSFSSAIA